MEIGSFASLVVGADLEAKMTALKELGYDFIELVWRTDVAPELGEAYGESLRKLSEKTGCAVRSAVLGTYGGLGDRLHDPEQRAQMLDEITRGSAAIVAAGGDVLLLNTWVGTNLPEHDARYVSLLREASDIAARYGVKLGMEHIVGSKWRNRAAALFELAEMVDRPNVGVYFDIANSLAVGEDPIETARLIASRLIQFHVKDHPASGRSLESMPLREIKAIFDAAGYTGRVATEIDPIEENGVQTNAHLVSALATLRQNGY